MLWYAVETASLPSCKMITVNMIVSGEQHIEAGEGRRMRLSWSDERRQPKYKLNEV